MIGSDTATAVSIRKLTLSLPSFMQGRVCSGYYLKVLKLYLPTVILRADLVSISYNVYFCKGPVSIVILNTSL